MRHWPVYWKSIAQAKGIATRYAVFKMADSREWRRRCGARVDACGPLMLQGGVGTGLSADGLGGSTCAVPSGRNRP